MKTLILAISASILIPAFATAGDDTVPLEASSKGGNLYRIVPRGTMIPENRGGQTNLNSSSSGYNRRSATSFKPTQHYYTKDATVSYRYTEVSQRNGSKSYLGPNASYFTPHREGLAPNVSIRNLAHVEPSRQPGVPMRSSRWREANINNFHGDTYYRRAEGVRYYHGGDVEPSGRSSSTTTIERVDR
jgi:hypothetical protein